MLACIVELRYDENKSIPEVGSSLNGACYSVDENISGVVRAFPGGQSAHLADQNAEGNSRKNERILRSEERLRKCFHLAHPRARGWLRP